MSSSQSPTLLDDVRRVMRLKHYSLHTERSYCEWIKQFVKLHRLNEPVGCGEERTASFGLLPYAKP